VIRSVIGRADDVDEPVDIDFAGCGALGFGELCAKDFVQFL
jgi:hypothetical protein